MSNILGGYDEIFFANEALIQLEKTLGMAGAVYRDVDKDPQEIGSSIQIRRPSTFIVKDAPSAAQDIEAGSETIHLSEWKEIKFKVTDKELAWVTERIISEHIRPAAVALADHMDTRLTELYKDVPWVEDMAATVTVPDLIKARTMMFNNKVPLNDPNMLWGMVDGNMEGQMLAMPAFSQHSGAGDVGVATQVTGVLGNKYGLNWFANQNTQTHNRGTAVADGVGALVGAHSKGALSIGVDGVTTAGAFKKGDTLVIAGSTQRYAITADATAAGGAVTLAVTPALAVDYADNAVVTIDTVNAKVQNLAWHKHAFALAMAPLPQTGNGLGARIATATDPITGLSLRSRIYYEGNASEVHVALDVLYGVKTLNPNLAVRLRQ